MKIAEPGSLRLTLPGRRTARQVAGGDLGVNFSML
jgi:hypothetical protein